MESFDIVKIAVKAADSKKGKDIAAIKIRDVSVLADYFVLVTGDSSTQVKALADEIEFKLGEAGEKPHHIEGRQSGWICLDYNSVVIHERLWEDGENVDISEYIDE